MTVYLGSRPDPEQQKIFPDENGDHEMMNWDYTMNGWLGGWMWIPMVLVVAFLTLGVIALVRGYSGGAPRQADDPLAIAGRRLDHGDISTAA